MTDVYTSGNNLQLSNGIIEQYMKMLNIFEKLENGKHQTTENDNSLSFHSHYGLFDTQQNLAIQKRHASVFLLV